MAYTEKYIPQSVFVGSPTNTPGTGSNGIPFGNLANQATEYYSANVALTGDYTVPAQKAVLTVSSFTSGTVYLPANNKEWSDITIKNYSASTFTINGNGRTIDYLGTNIGSSISCPANTAIRFLANGSGWIVIPEEATNIRNAIVRITSAQVLALNTTPITLIAAQTGVAFEPLSVSIKNDYKTTAYTVVGVTGTDIKVGSSTYFSAASTSIYSATSAKQWVVPNVISVLTDLSVNAAVTISTAGANAAGGNSDLVVEVLYKVHTFA
jgi:hypothetical protein